MAGMISSTAANPNIVAELSPSHNASSSADVPTSLLKPSFERRVLKSSLNKSHATLKHFSSTEDLRHFETFCVMPMS